MTTLKLSLVLFLAAASASSAVQFPQKRAQLDMNLTLEYEIPHGGRVTALAFSRDGRQLATSTNGRLIRLWDSQSGKELKRLNEAGGQLIGGFSVGLNAYSLAFSPNGTTLAAAGDVVSSNGLRTGTEIDLWNLASGKMRSIVTSKEPTAKYSQSVTFAPDGRTLFAALMWYEAGGSPGGHIPMAEIDQWDVETLSFKGTWKKFGDGLSLQSVALSPDGKTFAIGYNKETPMIALWDVQSGALRRAFQTFWGTYSLSFSPDGKRLASCQDPRQPGGNPLSGIVICDTEAGYLGTIATGQSPFVSAAAFSPDGVHLATGDTGNVSAGRLADLAPTIHEGSTVRMWRIR